jgi:hypothetical protein
MMMMTQVPMKEMFFFFNIESCSFCLQLCDFLVMSLNSNIIGLVKRWWLV